MNLLKKNYDLNDLINCWKKLKIISFSILNEFIKKKLRSK